MRDRQQYQFALVIHSWGFEFFRRQGWVVYIDLGKKRYIGWASWSGPFTSRSEAAFKTGIDRADLGDSYGA